MGVVRDYLLDWRELVIRIDDVLSWKQDFYPLITIAAVTVKFLLVWYFDPTFLSAVALIGLNLTISDYVGPIILNKVFPPAQWNSEKERRFDAACNDLTNALTFLRTLVIMVVDLKEQKPILHLASTLASLVAIAWLGTRVNNFFLLYLTVVVVLMLPGFYRRGYLKKYASLLDLQARRVSIKKSD